MKISKKDALMWFEFFAQLPDDEQLMTRQQEIVYAAFAQIEEAVEHRREQMMKEIKVSKGSCRRIRSPLQQGAASFNRASFSQTDAQSAS